LDSYERWVRSAALQALVEELDGPQLADDVGKALEQLDALSLWGDFTRRPCPSLRQVRAGDLSQIATTEVSSGQAWSPGVVLTAPDQLRSLVAQGAGRE
jgi:hypothetical protein